MAPSSVRLDNLVKSFRGTDQPVRAVQGVDLSVERGETVAVLGPNGAGKSTTLDILLGLTEPDSGAVSIFGAGPHEAIVAGRVGAMLQTGALIHELSVRELVSMMASLYPQPLDVEEVLEVTGLVPLAKQRTQKLSGGQANRVRLALALVSDPELLVLDEPTVGLDVEARRDFWATMRSFAARGKTVIFATHYLEEADAYADRVVLMAHGQVVADGPTTEIKAMVGARTIRATLPDADVDLLGDLPGVTVAERHGETVILSCSNSDVAIRALLERYDDAQDIEIAGAGLEQAFLALTGDHTRQTAGDEVFA